VALPREYAKGLHEFGDHWINVTPGDRHGRHSRARIRFCCPPEIHLLELCGGRRTDASAITSVKIEPRRRAAHGVRQRPGSSRTAATSSDPEALEARCVAPAFFLSSASVVLRHAPRLGRRAGRDRHPTP
jgi:hypothetical protein